MFSVGCNYNVVYYNAVLVNACVNSAYINIMCVALVYMYTVVDCLVCSYTNACI